MAESFALHFSGRAVARQPVYTSRPCLYVVYTNEMDVEFTNERDVEMLCIQMRGKDYMHKFVQKNQQSCIGFCDELIGTF